MRRRAILLSLVVVVVVSGGAVAFAVSRSDDSAIQCPAGYGYTYGSHIRGHCTRLASGSFGPMVHGAAHLADIPDYIQVAARDSDSIVGYVKKADMYREVDGKLHLQPGNAYNVYARDGVTLIGHMYSGQGFVPLDGP